MENPVTFPLPGETNAERTWVEIVQQKDEKISCLNAEVEKLNLLVAWFQRQMFGSKTEHYVPTDDTPTLFPEENLPEPVKETQSITVAEHDRHARQPNALAEIPEDLPREERVIDVPEDQRQVRKNQGIKRYTNQ